MGTGGNQVPVVHTIAGNIISRENKNGGHQLGIGHDVSPTLNTVDRHAVAYSMGHDERSAQFTPNKTDPLTASDYKQPPIVGYRHSGFGHYDKDEKAGTQKASGGDLGGGSETLIQNTVGALCARDYKGVANQYVDDGKLIIDVKNSSQINTNRV